MTVKKNRIPIRCEDHPHSLLLLFSRYMATVSPTLCNPQGLYYSRLHGSAPGKNTRVFCHFLLHGIFPEQGSNWRLLNWQGDLLLRKMEFDIPIKENSSIPWKQHILSLSILRLSYTTPCYLLKWGQLLYSHKSHTQIVVWARVPGSRS